MIEEEEAEEVQVITLVTLNLLVWGFRVEPIINLTVGDRGKSVLIISLRIKFINFSHSKLTVSRDSMRMSCVGSIPSAVFLHHPDLVRAVLVVSVLARLGYHGHQDLSLFIR